MMHDDNKIALTQLERLPAAGHSTSALTFEDRRTSHGHVMPVLALSTKQELGISLQHQDRHSSLVVVITGTAIVWEMLRAAASKAPCSMHGHRCCRLCPQALHVRLEPLLLFFIDGANAVEKDDPKWELLLALQPASAGTLVVW